MRRFLEDLASRSREKVSPWLDDVRALRVVAADVAQYAADRLRDLRQGKRSVPDPMETLLNQLILELGYSMIDAKQKAVIAIADEKRLAKHIEQERANADEWTRRALDAARAGDDLLVAEAHKRRSEHEMLVATLSPVWQAQKSSVEQLKAALRALNNRIENAKRAKNVILARRQIARMRETVRLEFRRADEIMRLVDRLSALADPDEPDQAEEGEDNRGPLN
jgi:phage shock protein A